MSRCVRARRVANGRQLDAEIDRVGLRLQLRRAQARAGDIVLLYADESEALTHPYLARAWAKRGADLRVPAPGQAKTVPLMRAPASLHPNPTPPTPPPTRRP